jgi:hypothetical protein
MKLNTNAQRKSNPNLSTGGSGKASADLKDDSVRLTLQSTAESGTSPKPAVPPTASLLPLSQASAAAAVAAPYAKTVIAPGIKSALAPFMGKPGGYIHFDEDANLTVTMKPGPGLRNAATATRFVLCVVKELRDHFDFKAHSPAQCYEFSESIMAFAIHLSHWGRINASDEISVANFLPLLKRMSDLQGASSAKVCQANEALSAEVSYVDGASWASSALGDVHAALDVLRKTNCTELILWIAMGQRAMAMYPDISTGMPLERFGPRELEDVWRQIVHVGPDLWGTRVATMLQAAGADLSLSDGVLELAAWVEKAFAPRGLSEGALTSQTAAASLMLSVPREKLEQMIVTRDDLAWLRRESFVLLGYVSLFASGGLEASRLRALTEHRSDSEVMASARELIDAAKLYMETEEGRKVASRLLEPTAVLERTVIRLEKLAQLEKRLQIDFTDEPVAELLEAFFPQRGLALHGYAARALTYTAEDAVAAQDVVQPGQDAPLVVHATPVAAARDAEDARSIDEWRAIWAAYQTAKKTKARLADAASTAGAPGTTQTMLPARADVKPGLYANKQPGSKPRVKHYNHHLPGKAWDLPKPEVKRRLHALLTRETKWTKELARELRHGSMSSEGKNSA